MIETIKLKHGNSYRARITDIDGKSITQTFKRKADAEKWKRYKLQEKDQARISGISVQDNVTFFEFFQKWYNEKVIPTLSKSTQINYLSEMNNHIFPVLKEIEMKNIRINHAHQIVLSMQAKKRTANTINKVMGLLQGILNDAVRWEYLHRNPLFAFKPLKIGALLENYWTAPEIDQFLRANMREPLYPIWVVALNTGLRRGELAGLKWDRVSFQRKQITITRTASRWGLVDRTKTGKKRVIPMNDTVHRILWPIWQKQKSEFVFHTEEGSAIDVQHLYRDFDRAQKKAGFTTRIRFHDLRHTFASHFMMNDGNIYDLQKILGHTTTKMTERYAHLSPTHLENAMQIVSFGSELGEVAENDSPKIVHKISG